MDDTDVRAERRTLVGGVAVLCGVVLLAAADLVGDLGQGTTVAHAAVEGAIVLAGTGGLAVLWHLARSRLGVPLVCLVL